jgi:ribonuclease HI
MVDQPVRVVAAACDGACRGNPGPGGWGALLRFENGQTRELGGFDPATTNNRMELTAALALFAELRNLPRHPELVIRTDSRYLIDGLQTWLAGWKRRGWRTASGGPVLNQELWQQLEAARLPDVRLVHVRGHSGDPDNDRCDAIAVAFAQRQTPRLASGGPGPGSAASGAVRDLRGDPSGDSCSGPSSGPKPAPHAKASQRTRPAAAPGGPRETLAARQPEPRSVPADPVQPQGIAAVGAASSDGPAPALGTPDDRDVRAEVAESRTSADRSQDSDTTQAALELDDAMASAAAEQAAAEQGSAEQSSAEQGSDEQSSAEQGAAAPAGLNRLLSRLELADRLAAGGYGLSLVELAQLVELPLRRLEERQRAWTWRDWRVEPLADGRWRLERGAGGLEKRSPG